jgi:hypothetical protein
MSGLEDEEPGELEAEDGAESTDEESSDHDDEFGDELAEELADEASAEFDDDTELDPDEDLKVVDEVLSHKDQNARALAIRRAIEERLEAKRLSKDLDYLDLDLDTDD